MQSIQPPKTFKFYQLIKMSTKSGLSFSHVGMISSGSTFVGTGFYHTLEEAEYNRTLEALKDSECNTYHIFELEFPNPTVNE